jgi:hypothetical protein
VSPTVVQPVAMTMTAVHNVEIVADRAVRTLCFILILKIRKQIREATPSYGMISRSAHEESGPGYEGPRH